MYGGVSALPGSLLQVCAGACVDGEGEMEMEEMMKKMVAGEETRTEKRTKGRSLGRARALRLLRSSRTR